VGVKLRFIPPLFLLPERAKGTAPDAPVLPGHAIKTCFVFRTEMVSLPSTAGWVDLGCHELTPQVINQGQE
jgi:hypothetical protein